MKKITSILSILMLAGSTAAIAATATFSDVSPSTTYQKGIEFLESKKIINGYPDGTYKPENTLNRAEMIKIIAEGAATYFNWPEDTFKNYISKKCFSDVPSNLWYTKYICYGKEKGWVKGYDDGTFRPDQTVTFVEGLKITLKGFDLGYTESTEPWYKDAVTKAGDSNYIPQTINGFANGLKRGEMADMITRIIKDDKDELDTYLGDLADLAVTYETIESGINLTDLETVTLTPTTSAYELAP
ncbi:MAG: S-layer homology domain-containing protein [bacterium]|nr:S-layer homology domain-containing protein [bacterium]